MNELVKTLWTDALRSGEFKQGNGHLRTGQDNYCCLGVLCELYRREVGGEWQTQHGNVFTFASSQDMSEVTLTTDVWEWAELPVADPAVGEDHRNLSSYNDSGTNFDKIADLIEQYL